MRKITTVILALIIVTTLTGCGKKEEPIPTQTPAPSPVATPTVKPTESTPTPTAVTVDDNSFITTIKLVTPDSIIFEFDGKEIEVMAGDYERITKNGIYDGMKIKVTYDGKVKKASDLKNRKLLKMEEID